MKLLGKHFAKDDSGTAVLIPEESEDLWHLYNLVAPGDTVKATTIRKVQKESSSGTVQAETKKILLTIQVKSVEYDAAGDCIRFSGKNCEENQYVKMGAHHTIEIEINNKLTLGKDCWDFMFLQCLDQATDVHKSAEVACVLIDAGIANFHLLTAVLVKDVHRVSVALPKKRVTTTGYDKAVIRFFEQVYNGVKDHINLDLVKCVLFAGPGFVKDDFLQWMITRAAQQGDMQIVHKKSVFTSAHSSCVHKQALKELLADEQVQKRMANTKAAAHQKALDEFYHLARSEPDRVSYGPKQVKEAVDKGGVATLMVVDALFRNASIALRRQYVAMAESVREQGAIVHIFSSQHVSGDQLQKLGGVAAILRFPMPELDDINSEDGLSVADDEEEAAPRDIPEIDDDTFM